MTDEIREHIELFFFDPTKSRDDFIEFYKIVHADRCIREGGRYRYSPLYLLLRDARYCYGLGRERIGMRDPNYRAEFAGIVLINIAFTNLIKKIYSGRFDSFVKKYMTDIDATHLQALRDLRNALEHEGFGYSLFWRRSDGTKVYFALGYFDKVIEKDEAWNRPYKSELYKINPRKLLTSFLRGVDRFKGDLLIGSDDRLLAHFVSMYNVDTWMLTGP